MSRIVWSAQSAHWQEKGSPAVSVVVLGYLDALLLKKSIATFVQTASKAVSWELVLVLNGAAEEVEALARSLLLENFFPLNVLSIISCRPGAARNYGVKQSRAPIILFLDDDTECFQDLLQPLVEIFSDTRVRAAGGPNLTPPNSGQWEMVSGEALGSWFGCGPMKERYALGPEGPANEHSLILCNLALRRSVFEDQKGFAINLISNEENVLLQRLQSDGVSLWSSPRLAVFHRRRSSWEGFCEQAQKYGSGRAQNLLLLPSSFHPMYLLPSIFLVYVLLSPLLVAVFGIGALLPLVCYGFSAVCFSVFVAGKKRKLFFLKMIFVFFLLHLSYGWGFLRTLMSWSLRRKKLLEHAL